MKKSIALIGLVSSLFAVEPMALLEQNGCTECHQLRGAKMAPGWMGISMRAENIDVLMNTIKNGSSGKYPNPKFKDVPMPSYAHLEAKDIEAMAVWVYKVSR